MKDGAKMNDSNKVLLKNNDEILKLIRLAENSLTPGFDVAYITMDWIHRGTRIGIFDKLIWGYLETRVHPDIITVPGQPTPREFEVMFKKCRVTGNFPKDYIDLGANQPGWKIDKILPLIRKKFTDSGTFKRLFGMCSAENVKHEKCRKLVAVPLVKYYDNIKREEIRISKWVFYYLGIETGIIIPYGYSLGPDFTEFHWTI